VEGTWWETVQSSPGLRQGDLLVDCSVPIVPSSWNPAAGTSATVDVEVRSLIVVTQSCDLENNKAPFVATCPVYLLSEYAEQTPHYKVRKNWEPIRQGKSHFLHMLGGYNSSTGSDGCMVIDFRQTFSLPIEYLSRHAQEVGTRYRLRSPYLEHMAQAYARFFMRVGLPSSIPEFK
jgi:hypothetical protein